MTSSITGSSGFQHRPIESEKRTSHRHRSHSLDSSTRKHKNAGKEKLDNDIQKMMSDFVDGKSNITDRDVLFNQVKNLIKKRYRGKKPLSDHQLQIKTEQKINSAVSRLYPNNAPASSSSSKPSKEAVFEHKQTEGKNVRFVKRATLISENTPSSSAPEVDLDKIPTRSALRRREPVGITKTPICTPVDKAKYEKKFEEVLGRLNQILSSIRDVENNIYEDLDPSNFIHGEKETNEFYQRIHEKVIQTQKEKKLNDSKTPTLRRTQSADELNTRGMAIKRRSVPSEKTTPVDRTFWYSDKELRSRLSQGSGDAPPPGHEHARIHDGDPLQMAENLNLRRKHETPAETAARKKLVDDLHTAVQNRYDQKHLQAVDVLEDIIVKEITQNITKEDTQLVESKRYILVDNRTGRRRKLILPALDYQGINILAPWFNSLVNVPHPSKTGWSLNAHHRGRFIDYWLWSMNGEEFSWITAARVRWALILNGSLAFAWYYRCNALPFVLK